MELPVEDEVINKRQNAIIQPLLTGILPIKSKIEPTQFQYSLILFLLVFN